MLFFGKKEEYKSFFELIENKDNQEALSHVISVAVKYGLCGKLWHVFTAWLILNDENVYTLSAERRKHSDKALFEFAMNDFKTLFEYFNNNFEERHPLNTFFASESAYENSVGKIVSELAKKLSDSKNAEEFKKIVDNFYEKYGVGILGLNRAFSLKNSEITSLKAAEKLSNICFSDLWGYEIQKNELIRNTEIFLSGKSANNVLLCGDSGTGKSTMVKALLNEYYDSGLRIIEVYKHQFRQLPELIDKIKFRNYKFIIFMDDLSFEDFEIEYKYLKALIEGGIEPKPDNILIYATSNRRHLIKENMSDRDDLDDKHKSDTIQEKLSLAERFGLSIYYPKPAPAEYKKMVLYLAQKEGIELDENELLKKAHIWGMEHGRLSGRIARQFINSLK